MPKAKGRTRSSSRRKRESDRPPAPEYSADDEGISGTDHTDDQRDIDDDDGDTSLPKRPDSLERFTYSLPPPADLGMESTTSALTRAADRQKRKKKKKRVRFALPPEDGDSLPPRTPPLEEDGDRNESSLSFQKRASMHTPPPEHLNSTAPNTRITDFSSSRTKPPVMRDLDETGYTKPYSLKRPLSPRSKHYTDPRPLLSSPEYTSNFIVNRKTLSPNSLEKLRPKTSNLSLSVISQTAYDPKEDDTDLIKKYASDVSVEPGKDGLYTSKVLPWYLLPINFYTRQPSPVRPMGRWTPVPPPGNPEQHPFSDVLPYTMLGEWTLGVPTHQPTRSYPEIRRLQEPSFRMLHVKASPIMGQSMILEEGWRARVDHWQRPLHGPRGAEDKLMRHRANQAAMLRDKEKNAFRNLLDIITGNATRWPDRHRYHFAKPDEILNESRGPKPLPSDSSLHPVIHDVLRNSHMPQTGAKPVVVQRPLPDLEKFLPDVIDRGGLGPLKCSCCEPRNREQRSRWRGELPITSQALPPITSSSPDQVDLEFDDMYYRTEASPLPPIVTQLESVTSEVSSIRPPDQLSVLEQARGLALVEQMGLLNLGGQDSYVGRIPNTVFQGGLGPSSGRPIKDPQAAADEWLTAGILAAWTNSLNAGAESDKP